MLKRRIIIGLLFKNGVLHRTKKFIPDYRYTLRFVDLTHADEVFMIDVTPGAVFPELAFREGIKPYVEECFTPITMGGGIKTAEGASLVLRLGGDKAIISAKRASLIPDLAFKYGSQFVTVGLDYREGEAPLEKAMEIASLGAGEILLQNIDRDGSLSGYDIPFLKKVIGGGINCPVVIGSGCSGWADMEKALRAGADGCMTANIHHISKRAMISFKQRLYERGVPVRNEVAANRG